MTSVAPASAGLTLTAAAPTVTTPISVGPISASLTHTDAIPPVTVIHSPRVDPGTAAMAVTCGTPTVTALAGTLAQQCATTWRLTRELARVEDSLRNEHPLIRIWDAEWTLQHVVTVEYKASFSWISNDTGPGQIELPFDSPVAQWIYDDNGRVARGEGRNVCITVDYCGTRWGGLMDKFAVQQHEDGSVSLLVDFMHDYEHVKWVTVRSNPFLWAAFQFPRAFVCAGPVTWALKMCLFLNLLREQNPLLTLPDDPLNPGDWFTTLDMSTWHMVVAPESFLTAMASGVVWGIPISRWATWHDMAHVMLEDAELSVTATRWLTGDPPPWPGAYLRNGALVIDIVDKSGVHIGTSNGGTIFDGLGRTVMEFAEDFIDSTEVVLTDATVPPEYYEGNLKLTSKEMPYVVFREGFNGSAIESSDWINSPAKGVQISTGGHSAPGVNEAISATIQAAFDLLGGLVMFSSLGSIIDTLLKPLYEDTVLAWWAAKSPARAQHGGWERLFEYFQDASQSGGGKAFTIASLMVLRAGFWATKTTVSWKVKAFDGRPFMVGAGGFGHFFLDDRVGLVLTGDEQIHMDRARKIDLVWDEEKPPGWEITIGDDRILQDPAQRAWGKIETLVAGLRDLGVW